MNERELPQILDGIDEPVTVDELEAVVRRAGQRRRATLAAGAAGLLAIGAFGGAAVSWGGSGGPTGYAADQPDPAWVKKAEMAAMAGGGFKMGLTPTPLFRREANGVAIRAYRLTPPAGSEGACAPKPLIQAQLSNGAAVSSGEALDVDGDTFGVLGHGYLGTMEGEPATWVVVQAGAGTSTVRLTGGGASDAMAPQNGIAVLVLPGKGMTGTVEALGPDGAVIKTVDYTSFVDPSLVDGAPDPACIPKGCSTEQAEEVKRALAEVEAKLDDPALAKDVAQTRSEVGCPLPGVPAVPDPGAPPPTMPFGYPVVTSTTAAAPGTTTTVAAPAPTATAAP